MSQRYGELACLGFSSCCSSASNASCLDESSFLDESANGKELVTEAVIVWGQGFQYVQADVEVIFSLAGHGVGQDIHRTFDHIFT